MNDPYIQKWISVRIAVSAALIIGSFVFFIAYWISMFKQTDTKSYIYMSEAASKYYLFGLGALLSLNYIQAGIFQAVLIFFTMLTFFGVIFASFFHEIVDDKKRSLAYLAYYIMLFIWYLGIIIDLYIVGDKVQNLIYI
jgi:hypothetical protein